MFSSLVELDHGLDAILLEDDDTVDLPDGRADGVEHLAGDRGRRVQHREQQDVVRLLGLVRLAVELRAAGRQFNALSNVKDHKTVPIKISGADGVIGCLCHT